MAKDTNKRKHCWLVWNLANIISSTRFLAPINFFVIDIFWEGWDIKAKLICYLALFATDFIDGLVARGLGNTNNIGKFIDPTADKVLQLSGLIFLLTSVPLEDWIVIPVLGGEIPIFLISVYGIYMIVKKEIQKNKLITKAYKEYRTEAKEKKSRGEKAVEELGEFWYAVKNFPSKIYSEVKGEIIREIKISAFGKIKMFAYFSGVTLLILHTVRPNNYFWQGYVAMFSVGFAFCLLSYIEYYQKTLSSSTGKNN